MWHICTMKDRLKYLRQRNYLFSQPMRLDSQRKNKSAQGNQYSNAQQLRMGQLAPLPQAMIAKIDETAPIYNVDSCQ